MARYAVLGEDRSDAETLQVLIRGLAGNPRLSIKIKGYDGCGGLLRKGHRDLDEFARQGCDRFVVAYDADRDPPLLRYESARAQILARSSIAADTCCIVVPVQELEAWLLADLPAVVNILPGWHPDPISNPERIQDPKEHLEKLSCYSKHRPRYSHALHNPKLAEHIDLAVVERKCPSFAALASFVRSNP